MKKMNRREFLKRASWVGAFGLVSSYPVMIERYIVQINRYRLVVPNLPPAFSGLRLVHLSDLHYGFLDERWFIKDVIGHANEIGGDLIVCTGDYVHERKATRQIDEVWPMLSTLSAPLGVFSILGNHDHWANARKSEDWLAKTGQDLNHKRVALDRQEQRIWLVGAGDLWEDHRNLDDELRGIPDAECRIVLAHNPDTADTHFTSRVDLMISGHTHGGQVVVPFVGPPVLPVRNKNYSSGLKTSPRGTKVFISRGIGWALYPVRLNCFPEIPVLELLPG
jgi:uncharacterized protein